MVRRDWGQEPFYIPRKNKKISTKRLLLLLLFLCIIAVMPVAYGPFFAVKNIEVTGNRSISSSEIIKSVSYLYGKSLLMVRQKEVVHRIMDSVPVQEVKVGYKLPHTLIIKVKEREIAAALPYLSGFALIDSHGIVVKLESSLENYSIPVVTGLNVTSARVADRPVVDKNPDAFRMLLSLVSSLSTFSAELSEIHVESDAGSNNGWTFYLYTLDGYQIYLGDFEEKKIPMIKDILDDIRKNGRGKGILDMSHETPVFKPLEKATTKDGVGG
jgi:cell division protein FtsQ